MQHAFRCFEPFVSYAMPRPLWGGHPSRMTDSHSSNGGEAPILAVSNTVAGPPCASRRPDACSRMVNVLTTGAVKQREVTDPITTAAALNSLLRPDSHVAVERFELIGRTPDWLSCYDIGKPWSPIHHPCNGIRRHRPSRSLRRCDGSHRAARVSVFRAFCQLCDGVLTRRSVLSSAGIQSVGRRQPHT